MIEQLLNSYNVSTRCTNCNHPTIVNIPKGIAVSEHLSQHECGNCGVKSIIPVHDNRPRLI